MNAVGIDVSKGKSMFCRFLCTKTEQEVKRMAKNGPNGSDEVNITPANEIPKDEKTSPSAELLSAGGDSIPTEPIILL